MTADSDPTTGKRRHKFETQQAVSREVKRRVQSLESHGTTCALRLAETLRENIGDPTFESLAHPPYVSELRRRLLSDVCRIAQTSHRPELHFYTIAAAKGRLSAEDLPALRPKKLLESLRTLLNEVGKIDTLDGWMIAAFHNEYDPSTDSYQPHIHVVVCGTKYHAFEPLRGLKMFKGGKGRTVYRPIHCIEIVDIPRQISYLLKAYWPAKPSKANSTKTGRHRSRRALRIPEPRHAESLLFLHQQRFSDLVWLHGVAIKDGKLVPT